MLESLWTKFQKKKIVKFKKYKKKYFQHKDTDGELITIRNIGNGKEIIVVRHLYKINNHKYRHSLDIRYFTDLKSNGYYYSTRDGIQIKKYTKWTDWIRIVLDNIVDVYESVLSKKSTCDKGLKKNYGKRGLETSVHNTIERFF